MLTPLGAVRKRTRPRLAFLSQPSGAIPLQLIFSTTNSLIVTWPDDPTQQHSVYLDDGKNPGKVWVGTGNYAPLQSLPYNTQYILTVQNDVTGQQGQYDFGTGEPPQQSTEPIPVTSQANPPFANVSAVNVTDTEADITFSTNVAYSTLSVFLNGVQIGNDLPASLGPPPWHISGLNPSTTYEIGVSANTAAGAVTGSGSFITLQAQQAPISSQPVQTPTPSPTPTPAIPDDTEEAGVSTPTVVTTPTTPPQGSVLVPDNSPSGQATILVTPATPISTTAGPSLSSIWNWIKANPLLAGGIAVGGWLLLRKK